MENRKCFEEKLLFFATKHDSFNMKNKHMELIDQHHFVHAISMLVPNMKNLPLDVNLLEKSKYFSIKNLTLSPLINKNFIEAFVKRGSLSLMSINTRIDTGFCICVIPSGLLILNVDKDTYQYLGLQGQPSKFHQKTKAKYVIKINLKELCTKSKSKQYCRIKKFLTESGQMFDVLLSWSPLSDDVECKSIQVYFQNNNFECTEEKFTLCHQNMSNIPVPLLDAEHPDICLQEEGPDALYEWIGATSCFCTFGDADCYENRMLPPEPTCTVRDCMLLTIKGFFTPMSAKRIVQKISSLFKKDESSNDGQSLDRPMEQPDWISITMYGFVDAPVSWNTMEHGFNMSGNNNHTIILFNNSKHIWSFLTQHPSNLSI